MMFGGLIILGLLAYFLIQSKDNNLLSSQREYQQNPVDIVKERFARGEIDVEEYERKLNMLQ